MEPTSELPISSHVISSIGAAVFAEVGPLELKAVGEIPQLVREMLGPQLDAETNIVSLDEHGFLSSFIADIRNRLSRRQEIDRESTFFQESNEDGRVFASKVWFVGDANRRLYCIQPSDETDDYKRELLQRIRSAALKADCTTSISTPVLGEVDVDFVNELAGSIDSAIGIVDPQRDEVVLNARARTLLDLPTSMPVRIQTGRLRSYLADVFSPSDLFETFWESLIAIEHDTVDLRRGRPYKMELRFKSTRLDTSGLGVWKIEEKVQPSELAKRNGESTSQVNRLTGGIAHEFNNLLAPIVGNLSLLEDQLKEGKTPPTKSLRQAIADSLAAGRRASVLVEDLIMCSDNSPMATSAFDGNSIGLEIAEEFHLLAEPSCALQLDLDDDLWPVSGDQKLLKSIVVKLVNNAVEAGARKGEIRITTRNCKLIDAAEDRPETLEPGSYVVISVSDHGQGVPEELTSRIFEPFFTSKPQGQGVGLGLASSLGVARRHGGTLICTSSDGEGSTFSLFLPRTEDPLSKIPILPIQNREMSPEDAAGKTILIVDDEPMVRRLTQATLETSGYKALQAEDGIDALATIDEHPGEIDLILLDLTMPRMSGQEVLHELERRGSSIPVIVCTGFLAQTKDLTGVYSGGPSRFILKPFQPASLIDEVHQELLS